MSNITHTNSTNNLFNTIANGLIAQNARCKDFIIDSDGNKDVYGFILGEKPLNELITVDTPFATINRVVCNSIFSQNECEIIDLLQQIHDFCEPDYWEYQINILAELEDIERK